MPIMPFMPRLMSGRALSVCQDRALPDHPRLAVPIQPKSGVAGPTLARVLDRPPMTRVTMTGVGTGRHFTQLF
jgi:hypothetical protein